MIWVVFKHELSSYKATSLPGMHCIAFEHAFSAQVHGSWEFDCSNSGLTFWYFVFIFWLLFVTGQVRCFRLGWLIVFFKKQYLLRVTKNHFDVVWWSRQTQRVDVSPRQSTDTLKRMLLFFWTCVFISTSSTHWCVNCQRQKPAPGSLQQ